MGILNATKNGNGQNPVNVAAVTAPAAQPVREAATQEASAAGAEAFLKSLRADDPAIKAAIDMAFGSRSKETGERYADGLECCIKIKEQVATFLGYLEKNDPLQIPDTGWQTLQNNKPHLEWRANQFKTALKMAETSRKEQIQPQRDAITEIQNRYKTPLEFLDSIYRNSLRALRILNDYEKARIEEAQRLEREKLAEISRQQEKERQAAEERARTANDPEARQEAREKTRDMEDKQLRTDAAIEETKKPVEVAPPTIGSGTRIQKVGAQVVIFDDYVLLLESLARICKAGGMDASVLCARISKTEIGRYIRKNGPDSVPGAHIGTRSYERTGRPKKNGN